MPSYEDVTEPIMLDETGQDMAAAIRELKAVIQPTNVCIDLDVSLEVSGWSNSAPYVYNWMNNKVTTECAVKVNFLEDSQDTDQLYISYEKIVGGIQFEAETKPTSSIPVRIHIVNAEADSINNVTDEMVSTSVIPNASNVKQALTALKDADTALNSNIAKLSISSRTQFTSPVGTVDTTLSGYLRIGNVVYVFGVIATTSQINQNDIVISGIPAAEVNNTVVTIYDNTGGTAFNLFVNNAGNALLQTAIQINTQHSLRICFTYICRD